MKLIEAVAAAFSVFSRIPVPRALLERVDWDGGSALAGFPAVGVIQGLAMAAWTMLAGALGVPLLVEGAVLTVMPLVVNGGIHLDGLCDTADALASYADRTHRLEIMKDPRAGAFGVMAVGCYLLLFFSLAASWRPGVLQAAALVPLFAFSRALSGVAVARWPKARPEGMAASLAGGADAAAPVRRVLTVQAVVFAVLLIGVGGWVGAVAVAVGLVGFAWYRHMAFGLFGGVTGDLAGWFVQWDELAMVAVIVLLGGIS